MAVAAAQQAAAMRAAESRAQAAMMVEAVEDRAYEVAVCPKHTRVCVFCIISVCKNESGISVNMKGLWVGVYTKMNA